jgi:hypothetical protein
MNENLRNATESLRTSIRLLKSKISAVKADIDALSMEFDKTLDKFDKIDRESFSYIDMMHRHYERKLKLAEKEIRVDTIRQIVNNTSLSEDDEFSDIDPEDLGISTTVSILEAFIDIISDGDEGFELMSRAVLFRCVYEKLVGAGTNPEDYFILKVPEDAVSIADYGREFSKEVIDKTPYQLTNSVVWESTIGEVSEWWKTSMLPFLYGDVMPDVSDEPYQLDDIKRWKNNEALRYRDFARVNDVTTKLLSFKDRIDRAAGVSGLTTEFVRRKVGKIS